MKNFEDFQTDVKTYDNITTNALMRKYRSFMNYISKMVSIILKDSEQEIISWLIMKDNNDPLILSTRTEGNHYINIGIDLSNDNSHIIVRSFEAHDQYRCSSIYFDSPNNIIDEFFEHEYRNFSKCYTPDDNDHRGIVVEFVNQFNNAFYEKFKSRFRRIGLTIDNFKKSKYALTISDEKLSEICNKLSQRYLTYIKIIQECLDIFKTADEMWYTD